MSVVIPHYHDLVRLDLCLTALGAQTYPASRIEVIVADNASPEGPDAVAAVIAGRARLVSVDQKGAGPARNGGAAAATGEILAFTDADCIPEPDWIAAGVRALARAPVIGGAMRVLVEDEHRLTGPEAFERVFAFDNRRYVEQLGFTVTANLFCEAKVFASVGAFAVGISEDVDWCRRATAGGYALAYAADAMVGHPARRTWPELLSKWRRINREAYGLGNVAGPAKLRWLLRSLLLPASAVAHTPRVLSSPALTSLGDRFAALRTLYALRLWRTADAIRVLSEEAAR